AHELRDLLLVLSRGNAVGPSAARVCSGQHPGKLSAITTVIDASGVPLQRLLQKTDNRQLARVLPRANTRCRRTNCVATRQHQQ
ncbi:MAG: hypothetical protein ACK462_17545, partial [Planctomyces sp.]